MRNRLVLGLIAALCLGAIAAITLLQLRTAADRDAERTLLKAEAAVTQLQNAPYGAVAEGAEDPRYRRMENRFAREEIDGGKQTVDAALAELLDGSPPAALTEVPALLRADYAAIEEIYRLGTTVGFGPRVDVLGQRAGRLAGKINERLRSARAEYRARAESSGLQSIVGGAIVILLLLGAFATFHTRSYRLRAEKEALLEASRREALTDPLTGLGNRRALVQDLGREISAAGPDRELVLALFDLNGFKQYNDSFGHPAGDALLTRLGGRLGEVAREHGSAYRMGGDEFCMIARLDGGGGEAVQRAADALSESGEMFDIGCSYGSVVIPAEATNVTEALRISDQRMYNNKAAGRGSATRQSTDVLLKVLDERSEGLVEHAHGVAQLAVRTGRALGLGESELAVLHSAAELHDVGKSAVPEAILNKPGKLTPEEWRFIRQHTLIGERIVLAAPALAHAAPLIRSSHERVDGTGYPDGLSGEEIPLGARIIAVCDAYDAMLAQRSYAPALEPEAALAELRRCAGTQFDADVVRAFTTATRRVRAPRAPREPRAAS